MPDKRLPASFVVIFFLILALVVGVLTAIAAPPKYEPSMEWNITRDGGVKSGTYFNGPHYLYRHQVFCPSGQRAYTVDGAKRQSVYIYCLVSESE